MANDESDGCFGGVAERCWVQSEAVKLHDSGKGNDNCPAKTLDKMSDHCCEERRMLVSKTRTVYPGTSGRIPRRRTGGHD
jgi:hypothetical protein